MLLTVTDPLNFLSSLFLNRRMSHGMKLAFPHKVVFNCRNVALCNAAFIYKRTKKKIAVFVVWSYCVD